MRWWERARGLLWRPPLARGQGLLISPCNSIHTFGMGYPIDVVFLDEAWQVVKIIPELHRARFCGASGARLALELPGGEAGRIGIALGERLIWKWATA